MVKIADAPASGPDAVLAFCGHCHHFEVWALGSGGDCHKGHDPAQQTAAGHCIDKNEAGRGQGPGFDMSE